MIQWRQQAQTKTTLDAIKLRDYPFLSDALRGPILERQRCEDRFSKALHNLSIRMHRVVVQLDPANLESLNHTWDTIAGKIHPKQPHLYAHPLAKIIYYVELKWALHLFNDLLLPAYKEYAATIKHGDTFYQNQVEEAQEFIKIYLENAKEILLFKLGKQLFPSIGLKEKSYQSQHNAQRCINNILIDFNSLCSKYGVDLHLRPLATFLPSLQAHLHNLLTLLALLQDQPTRKHGGLVALYKRHCIEINNQFGELYQSLVVIGKTHSNRTQKVKTLHQYLLSLQILGYQLCAALGIECETKKQFKQLMQLLNLYSQEYDRSNFARQHHNIDDLFASQSRSRFFKKLKPVLIHCIQVHIAGMRRQHPQLIEHKLFAYPIKPLKKQAHNLHSAYAELPHRPIPTPARRQQNMQNRFNSADITSATNPRAVATPQPKRQQIRQRAEPSSLAKQQAYFNYLRRQLAILENTPEAAAMRSTPHVEEQLIASVPYVKDTRRQVKIYGSKFKYSL